MLPGQDSPEMATKAIPVLIADGAVSMLVVGFGDDSSIVGGTVFGDVRPAALALLAAKLLKLAVMVEEDEE